MLQFFSLISDGLGGVLDFPLFRITEGILIGQRLFHFTLSFNQMVHTTLCTTNAKILFGHNFTAFLWFPLFLLNLLNEVDLYIFILSISLMVVDFGQTIHPTLILFKITYLY